MRTKLAFRGVLSTIAVSAILVGAILFSLLVGPQREAGTQIRTPPGFVPQVAFAALPSGAPAGTVRYVTTSDGTACNASGALTLLCRWNGSAWIAALDALPLDYTNTATVGAVTINKAAGRVRIAATGTSVVVTNSIVTAAAHVLAVASTNDATCAVKNVVPAAGSFTLTTTAACTAETTFNFMVISAS